jgi:hypothetical protein
MGDFEQKQSDHQWAWEKGIKRKCKKHGIEYDPQIFNCCPKCREEEQEEEKRRLKEAEEREEKKRKLKEAFDRIIWPDQ